MAKPRYEGTPGGPALARRLDFLIDVYARHGKGPEALADALGVSLSTVYRWREGKATRISRAVGRVLVELEKAARK
jgi:transposase-like protein